MTDQDIVDHVKRLNRLYLAIDDALEEGLRNPTPVNWRRYVFCRERYDNAVIEGARRFGFVLPDMEERT